MNIDYLKLVHYNTAQDIPLKVSYLFLQQADLLLTLLAVSAGFSELNPVIANLINTPRELLLFKLVIPLVITLMVPGKLLVPAIALLSLVIGWNIKELLTVLF
ncbi:MAG: DUF5658 family protein [Dehalococcoidales bacterium]|nr:DUF5658 family protein [Dehalococcoidales bacterium]